ncbi:ParA family protein [Cellulomonas sp. 179-A 9B4 NHS]|uniref:ParA family protein n=1 Tax=Cellulomonas sp. 179-A 9B4 NHS TaxID=3142379 RepID=UPI00399FFBEF
MQTLTVASEKGGVGKTTVTLGLAAELGRRGVRVGVIDLDPRSTATTWLGVDVPEGEHVGAILGVDDVDGAAADLALVTPWNANVSVVPGSRDIATLETAHQEYGDLRLKRSLTGWDRDVVLIDSPNRQGGFLIRSALTASDRVAYTTTPDEDGRAGVEWARYNVARFRQLSPLNPNLAEAGIIVTRWPDTVVTRDARTAIEALRETAGDLLLTPFIPERVIVRSARAGEVWWGDFDRGAVVADAFTQLADALWPDTKETGR